MLKRKAKRLGKKPYKFRFVTTVHSAELSHKDDWTRTPMVVQWLRHSRNVTTEPCTRLEGNKTQTRCEWEEPLGMVVTLYKDDKAAEYDEKAYTFTLYESKGNKLSKPLAAVDLNLAEYASVTANTNLLSIHLLPIQKKLEKAIIHITVRCEAAVASDSVSEFDTMSDSSSVQFREDDAQALETDSVNDVTNDDVGVSYEEQFAAVVKEATEKGKSSRLQKEVERLSDDSLDSKSADQLRKYVIELKRLLDKEKSEHEQLLNALLVDYANAKVRLAQSEYDRERAKLEKNKALKLAAQMKLKAIDQQQKLTKLEARLAKTG